MRTERRGAVLLAVCVCVFVINVSTTVMNITLPTLVDELDATTGDLLWIVDSFNLTFAAFVLAAGSLSDRFGRRRSLLIGLLVFIAASVAGAFASSPGALIATRAIAGVGAAIVFPTTLSIISNAFADRTERAKAIGVWGAATGVAVALGPIIGGFVVDYVWWGAALLAVAGFALVAYILAWRFVPESSDPEVPRLDRVGLALSTAALGTLVHAIIQGPERGWGSATSLAGFGVALALLLAFVAWERRVAHPMLDVGLFGNLRFTAASGAVTVAFFALFGFIFLITQYFQIIKGYGAFEAGLRMLPVALSLAAASIAGTRLAIAFGSNRVVALGLLSLTAAFAWVALIVSAGMSYWAIAGQMVLLGAGLGLTTTPATEAIMGVVPAAKAGIGSAVNDVTRELGGTLGVAVIGSVALSVYRDAFTGLPADVAGTARESVGAAYAAAGQLLGTGDAATAAALRAEATQGFLDGLSVGCFVAAGVAFAGALLVAWQLPSHPDVGDASRSSLAEDVPRKARPGRRAGRSGVSHERPLG